MWLKRVLFSCFLLLIVIPFSWNSRLVWYQISYGIWSVGILVVGLLCYPRILWTQVVHFSFPVVWHSTIMCPHFLCLSQMLPWPYVGCAVRTCASFVNIFWPSWVWSCLHSSELPVNYPVFTVVMVIYHYVERIWRILVMPIFIKHIWSFIDIIQVNWLILI